MTLPTNDFNELERAVLDWLKGEYNNQGLTAQIDAAKFNRREWTQVGYYVYLDVPRELFRLDMGRLGGGWPLEGPVLKSRDIEYGGHAIFWGEDGYLNCIEMCSFGGSFREEVHSFELCPWEGFRDSG